VNARAAVLLLAIGALLGSAFTLYAGVPAAALGGWALAFVAAAGLAKAANEAVIRGDGVARDSFRLAQTGSALGVGTSALLIGGVDHAAVLVLGVVAIGVVLRGGAAGLGAAAPEAWRAAAGARLSRFSVVVIAVLALAMTLDLAGTGPSWTPDVVLVLRGVVLATAVWLAAFALASRDTVVSSETLTSA
jgi:hypothetical protein